MIWRRIEVSMTVEQAVGHEFEWRQPEVLRLLSIDGQRARDRHAALREQLRVVGYRLMWAGQVDIQTNRFPFPQDLRARSRLRDQHRAIHARLDGRSEEHTSELQSLRHLVCRLLLEKKNKQQTHHTNPSIYFRHQTSTNLTSPT